MATMSRQQVGNRVVISGRYSVGGLTHECYEVRDGVEVYVGNMYEGMALAWLGR